MTAGTTDRVAGGAVKWLSTAGQGTVGAASCIFMTRITVVVMQESCTDNGGRAVACSTLRIGSSNVCCMVGIPGRRIMDRKGGCVIPAGLVMTIRTAAGIA